MKNRIVIGVFSIALFGCKNLENNDLGHESKSKDLKSNSTIELSYMDKAVRPQDDFFLFSNGTWIKNNPVPPSESRWGSFNELEQSNNEKLMRILDSLSKSMQSTEGKVLGNYYQSYINMEKRNTLGITPLLDEMKKVDECISKADIQKLVASLHVDGVSGMFNFGISQDLKAVDKHIAYLGQGGIGLPNKEYYFSENKKDILMKYTRFVQSMFEKIGSNPQDAAISTAAVLSIETQLAEAMLAPAEMRIPEKTYNKRSLDQAKKLFGKFDFEAYLAGIGSLSFDSLIVSQPAFVERIAYMIENESLENWKAYFKWKLINHYAAILNEEMVAAKFDFYAKTLRGKSEMKPIKERAIEEITDRDFGELLGKAFVDQYFSESAKLRVNTMVDNLLLVFRSRINELDWMTTETKTEALAKLNAIGRKLGFPSKWEDFSALTFSPDTYFENVKSSNQFAHKKNMSELIKPVDKQQWGMPAHMVNAYYHPLLNEIAFPAGIMQPPFFSESYEDAVNYGRIGMVIGHEFTHGFDDMGSKFAADGSFKNWWSDKDREEFEVKTKLLGETFSAFCPIEGHCVNPDLTMGENIADLGGLTMAYHAYAMTPEFKSGNSINGFTPAQRFFVAYAQLWKINYTEPELKNRIANDSHSPGMYRVNGPLKNCPEFFEAFQLKEGDPMRNAEGKLSRIW
jgi:putative endopeptidase